ncbi:hypothetical protein HMPREF6745_0068 [Prevotella sp. oral taxon 472 str. F0295]|nr:hypothetical protein HMPREF6745_0068 [Prevotella sp. oral taxon 472 str. F0295]
MLQLRWNPVPDKLERGSNSTGTAFQITWNSRPEQIYHGD